MIRLVNHGSGPTPLGIEGKYHSPQKARKNTKEGEHIGCLDFADLPDFDLLRVVATEKKHGQTLLFSGSCRSCFSWFPIGLREFLERMKAE